MTGGNAQQQFNQNDNVYKASGKLVGKLSAVPDGATLTFSGSSPTANTVAPVQNGEPLYNQLYDVVAKVVPATPTITINAGSLSSDSGMLTIIGKGFDAWQQVRPIVNPTKYFNTAKFVAAGSYNVRAVFRSNDDDYGEFHPSGTHESRIPSHSRDGTRNLVEPQGTSVTATNVKVNQSDVGAGQRR